MKDQTDAKNKTTLAATEVTAEMGAKGQVGDQK